MLRRRTVEQRGVQYATWPLLTPDSSHAGAFIEHRYHLVIEAALLLGIIWLLVQSRQPPPPRKEALTEKVRRPHTNPGQATRSPQTHAAPSPPRRRCHACWIVPRCIATRGK